MDKEWLNPRTPRTQKFQRKQKGTKLHHSQIDLKIYLWQVGVGYAVVDIWQTAHSLITARASLLSKILNLRKKSKFVEVQNFPTFSTKRGEFGTLIIGCFTLDSDEGSWNPIISAIKLPATKVFHGNNGSGLVSYLNG